MLVLVSDLHLTDGSSGTTIDANAFRILRFRLRDLAYAASWREGRRYEPIQELHVVLLGDIFDLIRSTQWLNGPAGKGVRPWDDSRDPRFVDKVEAITTGILQRNKGALATIEAMTRPGGITVPRTRRDEDDGSGAGAASAGGAESVPVAVHVHYQVGNHDWFYHLSGQGYDRIRQSVVAAVGLANDPNSPFPWSPEESQTLREVYEQHEVWARHGDLYDSANYAGDRDRSSLGDGIVVEVLTAFHKEVEDQLGAQLPLDVLEGLKEIDNIRPLIRIPDWIDGLLRRACPDRAQARKVKEVWDGVARKFLDGPLVRAKYGRLAAAGLKSLFLFSKGLSIHALSGLARVFGKTLMAEGEAFYRHALEEEKFKNRTAEFIVYGHTHDHEVLPLDISVRSGKSFAQGYINTGTWRRVYDVAVSKPGEQEFMGYNVMTYAVFYKGDERNGRPFETWSATLGVSQH